MTYPEINAALIILRCQSYLKQEGISEDPFLQFPTLNAIALTREELLRWTKQEDQILEEKPWTEEEADIGPYRRLLSFFGGDPVLRTLLDLCIAQFVRPEFSAMLSLHFGAAANLHLAFLLEGIPFPPEGEILDRIKKAEVFCHIDRSRQPLQFAELELDERGMSFLCGRNEPDPLLPGLSECFEADNPEQDRLHPPFVCKELIERGVDFFREGGEILTLSGKGGRRFLAKHISRGLKRNFLFFDAGVFAREKQDWKNGRSALFREAFFRDAGICFYGMEELSSFPAAFFTPHVEWDVPLIFCTGKDRLPFEEDSGRGLRKVMKIELPEKLLYDDRKKLWTGFRDLYGLSLDPALSAMRYHLNASETAGVVTGFLERYLPEDSDPDTVYAALALSAARSPENELGRIVYSDIRLSDVKIREPLREKIRDMIDGVRFGHQVLEEWGLSGKYPYGRAVSLLMSGPPGTGKTMTANAIAGELRLPLYQVNLSHIVDKYIGETEKNLEKAFSWAEKTNSVLFFDEADALFGKRSEVKDAHDKYANTEISYLLQRIEAYEGIVILATNIRGNIDPAFLRRIRYVVAFENPDESERRAIWEACIRDVPCGEIDLDYLAAQFKDFTGSTIKTTFLNACVYAAGRNEKPGMEHLVHALKNELEKTTTVAFSVDSLGKYAYLA